MRIWTKCVIGPDDKVILSESEWYEYDGPVTRCGGGPDAPEPSEEERSLQREQTQTLRANRDILQRQVREQNLLAPFLFEDSGIIPTFNEEGEIISFEREPQTEQDRLREEIELGFLERSSAALKGELPINPALLRQLDVEEGELDERLLRQLGPGFETSTPGIEARDTFLRSKSDILESSRRGDLTLSESLGLAREGSNEARIDSFLARLTGVAGRNTGNVGLGLNLATGFGSQVSSFQIDRNMQLQANINATNARTSTINALFGAAGTGVGIATGIAIRK